MKTRGAVGAFPAPVACHRSAGFTLVELMVAMVLLSIVVGSIMTLMISQARYVSRLSGDVQRLDQVRTAQQLLSVEIADLSRGSVTFARSDSIAYRLPIQWGIICGPINRNVLQTAPKKKAKTGADVPTPSTIVALQFEPPADALGDPTPEGFALSLDGVSFSYYPDATGSALAMTPDTAAASACLNDPAQAPKAKAPPPSKKNAPAPPTTTQVGSTDDYYSSAGLTAAAGSMPGERTLIFAYLSVSHFLKSDSTGNTVLYRATSAGTQKLAWPFGSAAGFRYRLDDGSTATTVASGSLARIRAVQVNLPAIRTARGVTSADTINVQPWISLFNAR
jgi:prepilin-type N-terminal cleavage/methylation domain-containing protein